MKRKKLLELAKHGRDVGGPRVHTDHKAVQRKQEANGEALESAKEAHWQYSRVEAILRDALLDLEPPILRIEDDEHYHRRVLNKEPVNAPAYAYVRSVLMPLITAVKGAREVNAALGEPTKAALKKAEGRTA